MIGDLEFARPLCALAVLLAPALILLSRPRLRPEARATGALALWQRAAAPVAQTGRRRRRRVPPATWILALALVLGGLALAGPRLETPPAQRHWILVLDRRPGMYLPLDGRGGRTRLEAVLARAEEWLVERSRPGDRVRWTSPSRADLDLAPGARPPGDWLAAEPWPAPAPQWSWLDRPGCLWLSDRAPPHDPRSAGLLLSGGEAAPGAVAVEAGRLVSWDGVDLQREPEGSAPRRLRVLPAAADLPEPLERLLVVWAAAEGFTRVVEGPAELLVEWTVDPAGVGAGREARVGRDGWSAQARFPAEGLGAVAVGPTPIPWLILEDGSTLVDSGAGRVRLALAGLAEPQGDPAAFAVSWAELFEAAALRPPEVVALEHRRAAGAPRLLAPAEEPRPASFGGGTPPPPPPPLQAYLAGAAAVLAGLALLFAGYSSSRTRAAGSR